MHDSVLTIPYAKHEPASVDAGFAYINCRNNWPGNDTPAEASFHAWYDETYLHVAFACRNVPLRATNFDNQSAVSADTCCEIFIRPLPDGPYWNLEFNTTGAVNASHRVTRPDKTPLTDAEIATIRRTYSPKADEPVDEPDYNHSIRMTVDIPWSLLGIVPVSGLSFGANVYACAGGATPPYFLSWAPIASEKVNFHLPEFFGTFILE
ncbi:MAG: carbohydrate-binding family 9-like protein [Muribaculaceae bacterium]|nr:carbohydrate-binding family 9-like protein [Muribaculaceae bacterium]